MRSLFDYPERYDHHCELNQATVEVKLAYQVEVSDGIKGPDVWFRVMLLDILYQGVDICPLLDEDQINELIDEAKDALEDEMRQEFIDLYQYDVRSDYLPRG